MATIISTAMSTSMIVFIAFPPQSGGRQDSRQPTLSATAGRWPISHTILVGGVPNADGETALDASDVVAIEGRWWLANRWIFLGERGVAHGRKCRDQSHHQPELAGSIHALCIAVSGGRCQEHPNLSRVESTGVSSVQTRPTLIQPPWTGRSPADFAAVGLLVGTMSNSSR